MAKDGLSEKIEAVERLTALFSFERYVYVCIISVCLAVFLLSVMSALYRHDVGPAEITCMFSSSGGVAFMIGRILHMWNRSMALLDGKQGD